MDNYEPDRRKHGFQCPWSTLQILMFVLLFLQATFCTIFPLLLFPTLTCIFFAFFFMTIALIVKVTITDPLDPIILAQEHQIYHQQIDADFTLERKIYDDICERCEGLAVQKQSKHCRVCNKCIYKIDHHCEFVNTCIGYNNLTAFVCMLISMLVQQIVFLVLAGFYLLEELSHAHNTLTIGLVVVSGIASLFVTALLMIQILLRACISPQATTYKYIVYLRLRKTKQQNLTPEEYKEWYCDHFLVKQKQDFVEFSETPDGSHIELTTGKKKSTKLFDSKSNSVMPSNQSDNPNDQGVNFEPATEGKGYTNGKITISPTAGGNKQFFDRSEENSIANFEDLQDIINGKGKTPQIVFDYTTPTPGEAVGFVSVRESNKNKRIIKHMDTTDLELGRNKTVDPTRQAAGGELDETQIIGLGIGSNFSSDAKVRESDAVVEAGRVRINSGEESEKVEANLEQLVDYTACSSPSQFKRQQSQAKR